MKLQEKYIQYVRNAINFIVRSTGYPVLGKNLADSGIATRKQLRLLKAKGYIVSVGVQHGRTRYEAYYTSDEIPSKMTEGENPSN